MLPIEFGELGKGLGPRRLPTGTKRSKGCLVIMRWEEIW